MVCAGSAVNDEKLVLNDWKLRTMDFSWKFLLIVAPVILANQMTAPSDEGLFAKQLKLVQGSSRYDCHKSQFPAWKILPRTQILFDITISLERAMSLESQYDFRSFDVGRPASLQSAPNYDFMEFSVGCWAIALLRSRTQHFLDVRWISFFISNRWCRCVSMPACVRICLKRPNTNIWAILFTIKMF